MKFYIKRTSQRDVGPPCEEAKFEDDFWFVEIEKLEDLQRFVATHGDCIVKDGYEIEIYDDYRE